MTQAYPLQWPAGRPRTASRDRARFKTTLSRACDFLMDEIYRLGATNAVISSNVQARPDGRPYANGNPADPGVAVYFTKDRHQMVFSCDRWDFLHDNILAIAKTIEAMRGIERWGSREAMERAFSGFTALPPPPEAFDWRKWFGKHGFTDIPLNMIFIDAAYNDLAKKFHPDRGGDAEMMAQLNHARDEARKELG